MSLTGHGGPFLKTHPRERGRTEHSLRDCQQQTVYTLGDASSGGCLVTGAQREGNSKELCAENEQAVLGLPRTKGGIGHQSLKDLHQGSSIRRWGRTAKGKTGGWELAVPLASDGHSVRCVP